MHSKAIEEITRDEYNLPSNRQEIGREIGDAWHKRFNDYLDEKPGGRRAWFRIMFGSNVALLISLAAQITSDVPCGLMEQRKRLRKFSKDLREGIQQVLSTAEVILEVDRKILDRGVELTQYARLPGDLRAYSQHIAGIAKLAAACSTERVPKTADYFLFFLHAYVNSATGQPQWSGVATLLEAAYAGHGRCMEVDEEGLRKKIERMRLKQAQECSHFEQIARDYFAAGNGNWFTRTELRQMAEDFAIRLTEDQFPDLKHLK